MQLNIDLDISFRFTVIFIASFLFVVRVCVCQRNRIIVSLKGDEILREGNFEKACLCSKRLLQCALPEIQTTTITSANKK